MVGTHNHLEISYSRLVGGLPASLGRSVSTWIHNGTIVGLLSPENAVMLGLGSHILFRREYYRLETSQPQRSQLHYFTSTLRFERLSVNISGSPFYNYFTYHYT